MKIDAQANAIASSHWFLRKGLQIRRFEGNYYIYRMNWLPVVLIVSFVAVLFAAVFKSRRANPEQSSTEMHPDNFKKPTIERVENHLGHQDSD